MNAMVMTFLKGRGVDQGAFLSPSERPELQVLKVQPVFQTVSPLAVDLEVL